jgi:carboxymethylenebutenolidase
MTGPRITALLAAAMLAMATSACTSAPNSAGDAPAAEAAGRPAGGGDFAYTTAAVLPPGAAEAADRLASTPRHAEWITIPTTAGEEVRAWIAYPERSTPAPVVLVVHEIYGLTAWIRSVADQLAADGFIAIAPDLLSGHVVPEGPDGDPVREQATAAIRTLDLATYQQQLADIARWGMALPAATQRYGIVGFCWGGTAAFNHAVLHPAVGAAVVYYGSSPATETLASVRTPVLGLYGGDDARVNATVPAAEAELQRLGRSFASHFFEGAGHGFLRQQDGRDGANLAASRAAWPLTVAFFRRHLEAAP